MGNLSLPTVGELKVVDLQLRKTNGNLVALEELRNIPFSIARAFYVFDVTVNDVRGMHAHKACHQFLIALKGSIEVLVDDGRERRSFLLDKPNLGLHVPSGIWAEEKYLTSDTVLLVLADKYYDKNDYINFYEEFRSFRDSNVQV